MCSRLVLSLSYRLQQLRTRVTAVAALYTLLVDLPCQVYGGRVVGVTRQREHSAAAAELEVWKQKANGGRDGGPASNRDASLRQSRSEIVASEAARYAHFTPHRLGLLAYAQAEEVSPAIDTVMGLRRSLI